MKWETELLKSVQAEFNSYEFEERKKISKHNLYAQIKQLLHEKYRLKQSYKRHMREMNEQIKFMEKCLAREHRA